MLTNKCSFNLNTNAKMDSLITVQQRIAHLFSF